MKPIVFAALAALLLPLAARAETCRADVFAASAHLNDMTQWVNRDGNAAEKRAYNNALRQLSSSYHAMLAACQRMERRTRGGSGSGSSRTRRPARRTPAGQPHAPAGQP